MAEEPGAHSSFVIIFFQLLYLIEIILAVFLVYLLMLKYIYYKAEHRRERLAALEEKVESQCRLDQLRKQNRMREAVALMAERRAATIGPSTF